MSKNVLGTSLELCCDNPVTGFFRNGKCETDMEDVGMHTICVHITEEFLKFSKSVGNDLSTPLPHYGFSGLKEGDRWCICLNRWIEALDAGMAPGIYLKSTHISALEFIDMDILKSFARDNEQI